MPRGDKSSYTEKQRRQAEHIEEGYEKRGVNDKEAERRAWATVNAMTGGGKASGSGRGKSVNKGPARKGGRLGGAASAASAFRFREEGGSHARPTQIDNKVSAGAVSAGERHPLISLLKDRWIGPN
jgi:plasmid stabilization system protein ParE